MKKVLQKLFFPGLILVNKLEIYYPYLLWAGYIEKVVKT